MAAEPTTATSQPGPASNAGGKTGSGNPYASASLYVGDLDQVVTESHLFELFNAVGPVASIRVCRDSQTRRSLGYAYVNFHSVTDAERALDTMNFNQIRGRPCRIMWSQRDPSLRKSGEGNVFVKNLHKNITDQQLFDTFSVFGNILSCKVARNDKKESLEYGYVHYADPESAKKAIENVNGMMIANKTVSAELFKPRDLREQNRKWTNVYFKHIPQAMDQDAFVGFVLEKMTLTPEAISVDKNSGNTAIFFQQNDVGAPFCCINFVQHEDAFRVVQELNDFQFDEDVENEGKTLFVARAQKKKFRRGKYNTRRRYQRWKGGINLYVKNLEESIRDEDLKQIFAPYGQITSARVMLDRSTGKSRGFGFVCFSRKEDAVKAMSEMNSKEVRGKNLYVSRAQLKVARQQWLAKQRMRYNYPSYQNNYRSGPMTNQGGGSFLQPPYRGMNRQFPAASQMYPQTAMYNNYQRPTAVMGAMPQFAQVPAPMRPNMGQMGQMQPPTSGYMAQPIRGPTSNPTATSGSYQNPMAQIPPHPANTSGPMAQIHTGSVPQTVGSVPTQQGVSVPTQTGGVQSQPQPIGFHRQQRISTEDLANKTPADRKRIIGEQLFPRIQQVEPRLAGKITGMLLEMDDKELLVLLDSSESLVNKVNEALQVLREHQAASAGNTDHRE